MLGEIKLVKMPHLLCLVDLLDMFVIPSACLCTFHDCESDVVPYGKGKYLPMLVYMEFPYLGYDLAGLLENERVNRLQV